MTVNDWRERYSALVSAVRAYANALRLHGAIGERWTDDAPDLDRLWDDVLHAAGLDRESQT